jgi:hypothetical protein
MLRVAGFVFKTASQASRLTFPSSHRTGVISPVDVGVRGASQTPTTDGVVAGDKTSPGSCGSVEDESVEGGSVVVAADRA